MAASLGDEISTRSSCCWCGRWRPRGRTPGRGWASPGSCSPPAWRCPAPTERASTQKFQPWGCWWDLALACIARDCRSGRSSSRCSSWQRREWRSWDRRRPSRWSTRWLQCCVRALQRRQRGHHGGNSKNAIAAINKLTTARFSAKEWSLMSENIKDGK